jgi:hypothetical protein
LREDINNKQPQPEESKPESETKDKTTNTVF